MKSSRWFGWVWPMGQIVIAGKLTVGNGKWLDATTILVELLLYRNQKWATNMLQKMKLTSNTTHQNILKRTEIILKNKVKVIENPHYIKYWQTKSKLNNFRRKNKNFQLKQSYSIRKLWHCEHSARITKINKTDKIFEFF